ncbi:nitrate reductase molybdenum cofactor assembly chaperone [Azohydromonas sediminis]|uniref:nitrate reductase molybdenum cofactor assembly chaperone n=1 Tax=Azohydromonas sediminis TaxID=2259674 RepID=UPI001B354951|nr:nitrate reductase molybdenum cofactor assembly chaperone [Azohydromonas sediminis]
MSLLHGTPRRMTHTLRALAWLLRYPDAEMREALPAVRDALHDERALTFGRLAELDALIDGLRAQTGLRAEAEYVELFDRGRRTALYLFEHVHGDSRDRGQAMIDLAQTYERAGLLLAPGELPDHLPVVLEFASTQPPAQAREFLRETAHIVRAIFSALLARRSAYASVLAAVLDLAGERAERVELPDEPPLDEAWTEPEAFGGCSTRGQARPDQPQPIHVVRPAAPPRAAVR